MESNHQVWGQSNVWLVRNGKCVTNQEPRKQKGSRGAWPNVNEAWAHFTKDFFVSNSNWMETSPCCNSNTGLQITTRFCTCYDSTAVVTCAKYCSDRFVSITVKAKWNSHRIWIAMEKPLVPTNDWHILPMFSLTYFPWMCALEGCKIFYQFIGLGIGLAGVYFYPADTRRKNNVTVTSKRSRFDVIVTLLLRRAPVGYRHCDVHVCHWPWGHILLPSCHFISLLSLCSMLKITKLTRWKTWGLVNARWVYFIECA